MARKTLLNESEIRRFLKLADVGAIADRRLQEISTEEQTEGMMGAVGELVGQRDEEGEEEVDMEMGAEEPPMDDMGPEEEPMDDMGDPGGEGRMVSVDDFMGALESALEDVMGEPTSVEMSDEEEGEDPEGGDVEMDMDMEMSDEGPEEDPLQEDKASNKGYGPGKEAKDGNGKPAGRWLKEEEEDDDATPRNEEEIVNEVARRVAARLVGEKKKKDLAEQLADRILKRLTK